MPRQPRLDAPGTLHHVMSRGIGRLFCQLSVVKMGYPGAQVARLLGVTTSAVVRAANSEELTEVENYL